MANYLNTTYALLGLAMIASSCSQELPQPGERPLPGGRIEFMASLPEVSSRASEVTAANLQTFRVSAFTVGESAETPYFENRNFSRNSQTGRYACEDSECIWPNNNDLLRFVSFSPSCEEMNAVGGMARLSGDTVYGFKVPADINSHFDFVTAINSGRLLENEISGKDETVISLGFRHQLSRIQLKAWGNSQSFDIEIAGVRIGGIAMGGAFSLKTGTPTDSYDPVVAGEWLAESISKGSVQYIFGEGDNIVTLDGSDESPTSVANAAAILSVKSGDESGIDNSAMVIPSSNPAWRYKDNPDNLDDEGKVEGMYISVLLRVKDKTPYASGDGIVYPMKDDETVYLALDGQDGKTVKTRLYKVGEEYFTSPGDPDSRYDLTDNGAVVKAFAWAALPVGETLKPGRIYTYTLNYSGGVGLRDPEDSDPGTSIISDRVIVDVKVADWVKEQESEVTVPRK